MRARAVSVAVAVAALTLGPAPAVQASVSPSPSLPCAQPNGRVAAVSIVGGTAYIAGSFTQVKDRSGAVVPRTRLAAIDTAGCDLLPWTADASAEVTTLVVANGTVYVGGKFLTVNGLSRTRIAALDADTAELLPFNPVANKTVKTLSASATRLYAGGDFTKVGSQNRSKLAAFTLSTGALDSGWKPAANGSVHTIEAGTGAADVYVGGNFTSLNGSSVPYVAAVDGASGNIDSSFDPSLGGQAPFPILDLTADARGVYAGAGGSGGHLVIWNPDGSLQRPVYQTDGGVQNVTVDGDSLYVGGHFGNYCVGNTGSGSPYICTNPLPRRKIFEVALSTGDLTDWKPALNSARGVFASSVEPGTHALWVGGDFTKVGSKLVDHLAKFPS